MFLHKRRPRLFLAGMCILAVVLWFVYTSRVPGRFCLVYVYEANTHTELLDELAIMPRGMVPVSLEHGRLIIGADRLPGWFTAIGCIRETTMAGLTTDLAFISTSKTSLNVSVGAAGSRARLLNHQVSLRLHGRGGALEVSLGGIRRVLQPLSGLSIIAMADGDQIRLTEETPESEVAILQAVAEGRQASRLVVVNHGLWDISKVGRPAR